MSTTTPATASSVSSAPPSTRSPVERIVVWGGILLLLALVGYEFSVKKSYQSATETLTRALEGAEKDQAAVKYITNVDVKRILGKDPEFKGDPGQIYPLNSHYYEAYVWRSLIKSKFVPPPDKPELVDPFEVFSGEVRPQDIKYRTPGYDKNLAANPSFFDAHVLYLYYGGIDPKTKTRELIHISDVREKYYDAVLKLPDATELKRRHDVNMERMILDREKGFRKLTPEEIERMDSWKHPEVLKGVVRPEAIGQYVQPSKLATPSPSVVAPDNSPKNSSPSPQTAKDPDLKKGSPSSTPSEAPKTPSPTKSEPLATPAKPIENSTEPKSEESKPAKTPETKSAPAAPEKSAGTKSSGTPEEKKLDEKK